MSDDQERLGEILTEALAQPSPEARERYLDEACGQDQGLREQVNSLLNAHHGAGDFLRQTVSMLGDNGTSTAEGPGTVIGRYKLLQQIGEGGFGLVFMAEQRDPVRRMVALKVLKAGMDTREVIARFEAERQALALMDHPHIARVLDGGTTTGGRPYFVMDLVKGVPITDFCDQNQLPTEARLRLFMQVCAGVQHAHQKGIIHRDLKPTNVLVTVQEGPPVPKVIDFGIAKAIGQKLTERTLFTRFEQLIGTPAYMSPEQAVWGGVDIDTRTDIYSLGALLYELLTGTTPFEKETFARAALDEMRRMIRETEPPKPSLRLQGLGQRLTDIAERRKAEPLLLTRLVRGDLDWIVMKALDKDRARRYETANGLARDIQRHLNGEPVVARPPSQTYVVGKFIRKHRVAVTAGTGVVAALLAGLVMALFGFTQARHDRTESRRQELLARESLYAADINLAQHALEEDNLRQAAELLRKHVPKPGEPDLRGFEWRYLWRQCQSEELFSLPGHDREGRALAFSPDGHTLVTGGEARAGRAEAIVWDLATRQARATLVAHTHDVCSVSFSPSGQWLATTSRDAVCLWETKNFQRLRSLPGNALLARFSPTGEYFLADGTDGLILWSTRSWTVANTLDHRQLWGLELGSTPFAFSPEGTRLAVPADDGIRLYSVPDFQEIGFGKDQLPQNRFAAFSPDGHTLAACTARDKDVKLWRLADPAEVRSTLDALPSGASRPREAAAHPSQADTPSASSVRWRLLEPAAKVLSGHSDTVFAAAFSPDGRNLATCSADQTIKLWDVASGELIRTFRGHAAEVYKVAYSPDGKWLASIGKDGSVKVWDAVSKPARAADFVDVYPLGFSSDGNLIIHTWTNHTLSAFDPESLQVASAPTFRGRGQEKPFSYHTGLGHLFADGRTLSLPMYGLDTNKTTETWVDLWDLSRRQFLCSVEGLYPQVEFAPDRPLLATPVPVAGIPSRVEFAPKRRLLATGTGNQTVSLWHMPDGTRLAVLTNAVIPLAFSADETLLATFRCVDERRLIDIWQVNAGSVHCLATVEADPHRVAFSPDGRILASGASGSIVQLYAVPSGHPVGTLTGHRRATISCSFSPDGRTLASLADDGMLRLWHFATGRELLRLPIPGEDIHWSGLDLEFSPDGRSLVAARSDRQGHLSRVWFAPSLAEIAVAEGKDYRPLVPDAATCLAAGKALEIRERLKEAVDAFGQVVQRAANQPELEDLRTNALRHRAKVLIRLGRLPEAAADNLAALNLPPRNPHTPAQCLDLSPFFTHSLDSDSLDLYIPSMDFLAELPRGLQTLPGTKGALFDVRGVVQLNFDNNRPDIPRSVEGIPVGRKCRRLFFLQATHGAETENIPIGAYVAHYADGRQVEIPIIYGKDLRHYCGQGDPADRPEANVAWRGTNSVSALRIFCRAWENPKPEIEVRSLDFISAMTKSAPFLIALTADP